MRQQLRGAKSGEFRAIKINSEKEIMEVHEPGLGDWLLRLLLGKVSKLDNDKLQSFIEERKSLKVNQGALSELSFCFVPVIRVMIALTDRGKLQHIKGENSRVRLRVISLRLAHWYLSAFCVSCFATALLKITSYWTKLSVTSLKMALM